MSTLDIFLWSLWQSPNGKRWLTHWASMLRWRWSISEYNLTTRDSPKQTLKSGSFVRECRRSGPAKQKPKHNRCRPVGLARADLIDLDPKVSQNWSSKMRSGIVHHKSDCKSCVLPTADRNILLQLQIFPPQKMQCYSRKNVGHFQSIDAHDPFQ